MNCMIHAYLKNDEEYKARKTFYALKKNPALKVNHESFSPFVVHYMTKNVTKSAIAFFSIFFIIIIIIFYYNIIRASTSTSIFVIVFINYFDK